MCKYRLALRRVRSLMLAQVLGEGEDQLEYESAPILFHPLPAAQRLCVIYRAGLASGAGHAGKRSYLLLAK